MREPSRAITAYMNTCSYVQDIRGQPGCQRGQHGEDTRKAHHGAWHAEDMGMVAEKSNAVVLHGRRHGGNDAERSGGSDIRHHAGNESAPDMLPAAGATRSERRPSCTACHDRAGSAHGCRPPNRAEEWRAGPKGRMAVPGHDGGSEAERVMTGRVAAGRVVLPRPCAEEAQRAKTAFTPGSCRRSWPAPVSFRGPAGFAPPPAPARWRNRTGQSARRTPRG